MKDLEKSQEKIESICKALRRETLEPAEKEAQEIIRQAQVKADEIILQAEKKGEDFLNKAKSEMEREKKVFEDSLRQAARQGVEFLRNEIQKRIFNPELEKEIAMHSSDPKMIAEIISALVKAVEKKGVTGDLIAFIPKTVSPQSVNALLASDIVKKLKNNSVTLGDFKGGATLKLVNQHITLDMSNEAIVELLSTYIRKDFRKFIFGT